jgi:hypothetical protein
MKKFLLTTTAIAALSAMSTTALAVDLDNSCAGVPTFAEELVVDNTTVLNAAALTVDHTVGTSINTGLPRYFKYTLTNGEFTAPLVPGDISIPGAAVITIAMQGADYVIFERGPVGTTLLPTAAVSLNLNGKVKVLDKTSPIGVKYELWETQNAAQFGPPPPLVEKAGCSLAAFATGLAFSATPNTTTADVDAVPNGPYTTFFDGVAGASAPLLAKIGNVEFQTVAGVLNPFTGVDVLMIELVKAGTKLVLKTNQNWASLAVNGVFLSAGAGNCNAPSGSLPGLHQGVVVDPTTIDIPTNATTSASRAICYLANGTTPIEVQDFTVAFDVEPQTSPNPATTADQAAVPAGKFIRNGTILRHTFGNAIGAAPGAFTHTVQLVNRGAIPAPIIVRCLRTNSVSAGTAGLSVGANGTRTYAVGAGGLGCSTSDLRGVELVFGVRNGNVFGTMIRTSTTTGEANFDTMTGSQLGSN